MSDESVGSSAAADSSPEGSAVAPDLGAATRAFFPDLVAVEPLAGREYLARATTADAVWKVRRWPTGATERRVDFVHAVLGRARAGGVAVPALAEPADGRGTVLALGGRRYDAQAWLPGRPAAASPAGVGPEAEPLHLPAVLPEEVVVALAETIARVHAGTEGLARSGDAPVASLTGVVGAVRATWAAQRARLRPVAPRTPLVQRWLAAGERALPSALAALEQASPPEGPDARVVLHLGLWPAHVVLGAGRGGGGDPLGLIGWEGAAAGSPLLDLAHLVTRCRGWSGSNAELVLSAYAAVRPLAPEERRGLPAVAALDLIAAAGHLLDLAFGPRGEDAWPPPTALRAGAESLIASLETTAAVAAQGDAPRKGGARRWQHRPKPPGTKERSDESPRRPAGPGPRRGGGGGRGAPRRPRQEGDR